VITLTSRKYINFFSDFSYIPWGDLHLRISQDYDYENIFIRTGQISLMEPYSGEHYKAGEYFKDPNNTVHAYYTVPTVYI
jgi:hypothetical protein